MLVIITFIVLLGVTFGIIARNPKGTKPAFNKKLIFIGSAVSLVFSVFIGILFVLHNPSTLRYGTSVEDAVKVDPSIEMIKCGPDMPEAVIKVTYGDYSKMIFPFDIPDNYESRVCKK